MVDSLSPFRLEVESGVPMSKLFGFPNPVNETSARVVAAGVVAMTGGVLVLDQPWLLFPLTYGFAARVATGPKLSPLGQLATRVVTPLLEVEHRFAPGPPKRLAQGMGLFVSATATVLYYGFRRPRAAYGLLMALLVAAGLEAVFGFCVACKVFPVLVKVGLVPASACEECADIGSRPGSTSERQAVPANAG
jgi:Domain of unknown function (DUF4395)